MNKLVIIPVCNFVDLLPQICEFYFENLDEADIVIIYDGKTQFKNIPESATINVDFVIKNSKPGNLSNALIQALEYAENTLNKKYDVIITNEHDVLPKIETLYACLHVFEDETLMKGMASVSSIYKWDGKDCYPTTANWYNGWTVLNVPEAGECKVVGVCGVPFGFVLWKPSAFKLLHNDGLPPVLRLDTKFGELLYKYGYHHVRLVDYFVIHYNGGVKSWRVK